MAINYILSIMDSLGWSAHRLIIFGALLRDLVVNDLTNALGFRIWLHSCNLVFDEISEALCIGRIGTSS